MRTAFVTCSTRIDWSSRGLFRNDITMRPHKRRGAISVGSYPVHIIQMGRETLARRPPANRLLEHGGNARFDEEVQMSDTPFREPPPETMRHYSRPDPDMTDDEIDAWADQFVDAVLGDAGDHESELG